MVSHMLTLDYAYDDSTITFISPEILRPLAMLVVFHLFISVCA